MMPSHQMSPWLRHTGLWRLRLARCGVCFKIRPKVGIIEIPGGRPHVDTCEPCIDRFMTHA